MKMFNFGVSKSSACYNLELIAERFISKVIRIIMIKFERIYKLLLGEDLNLCVLSSGVYVN